MQERIERWLSFWLAKPIAWAIFTAWLALKYSWVGAGWCVRRLYEHWRAWRGNNGVSGAPIIHDKLPVAAPTKRASRREVARKGGGSMSSRSAVFSGSARTLARDRQVWDWALRSGPPGACWWMVTSG